MESPHPIDEESAAQPAQIDIDHAATRQAIAEKQAAGYQHCLLLGLRVPR